MRLIAIVFITMLSLFANARVQGTKSCIARDYRIHLGPNRDQGELSWCFAYSSADLITQRTGLWVSAADLATGYHLGDAQALLRIQNPDLQMYLSQHRDFLPRLKKSRDDGKGQLDRRMFFKVDGLAGSGGDEEPTLLFANMRGLCAEAHLPSTQSLTLSMLKAAADAHGEYASQLGSAPTRNQSDWTSAIHDPVVVSMGDFVRKEVNLRCQRRPAPFALIPFVVRIASDVKDYREGLRTGRIDPERDGLKIVTEVDRALDSDRIVAIAYGTDAIMPNPDHEDDDHSSSIVARRPDSISGECMYLLRNSYGEDCTDYLPPYKSRCERGNVWLTADEVAHMVYAVTTLR